MGSKGPKNLPGSKAPVARAPKPRASAPTRTPKFANVTPAKVPNGAASGQGKASSGLFKSPSVKSTTHKPGKSTMRAPRRADGASKI